MRRSKWWGKAGDQALRRSAFQEAIAPISAMGRSSSWRTAWARVRLARGYCAERTRFKLQTNYGQALILG